MMEKCACCDISAKLQKHTYNSLQFPTEVNTSGSETPTTFIPFHTNYEYKGR